MAEAFEDEDSPYLLGEFEESDFVAQYNVYDVVEFSSQYGSDHSISYTALNIIGPPKLYPLTVDSNACFQMRMYGSWHKQLPSYAHIGFHSVLPVHTPVPSEDFIEVKFPDRVYPMYLDFYEIFNPGAVVRIFGYCHQKSSWKLLWQDNPAACGKQSCIFRAHLERPDIKTNCFRVEFNQSSLDYFYGLDTVLLTGSSIEFPITSIVGATSKCSSSNECSNHRLERQKSVAGGFEKFPGEVMLIILSYLDLKSLCAASQVSSWFKNVCYDPILYRVLDLQLYWHQVTPSMLDGLSGRCASLQLLNLSWCGSRNALTPQYVILFIEQNCNLLTCLKLSNCIFVNNHVLRAVATSCKFIQVLELRSCLNQDLNHTGFSQISLLKYLTYLDLYRTQVDRYSITSIIKSCPKLEHLLLGACYNIAHYNEVVQEIAKSLRNLKTLDLWRARSLTEAGVFMLSEQCLELVELDLGWCISVNSNSGCLRQLVKNCPKLKKLILTAMRTVSDSELAAFACCSKELEQLDVLGTREITYDGLRGLLQSCDKLKLLDISFCQKINNDLFGRLEYEFSRVQIKRSTQSGIGI